jgi:translation initiation factor 2B subunit (eIF-2B alpha/beta/delta family)
MEQWIARRNISALRQQLADGQHRENEAELRRQLAEQEALLRKLNGPLHRR